MPPALCVITCLLPMPFAVPAAENEPPFTAPVTREMLCAPRQTVTARLDHQSEGIQAQVDDASRWQISGEISSLSAKVRLAPVRGVWDFSKFSLFSIRLRYDGTGIVSVETRLDNEGAEDWERSAAMILATRKQRRHFSQQRWSA